jgi:hypothetical protein
MVEDRGFYGRLPMPMQERMATPPGNHGWQGRTEPESTGYYSRCADGNYHRLRLPGAGDGLTDGFQGHKLELMLQRTGEWIGVLPNRIMVSDILLMQEITGKSIQEISKYDVVTNTQDIRGYTAHTWRSTPTWRNTFKAPTEDYDIPGTTTRIYNSIEEIEEELRDRSDDMHLDEAFHDRDVLIDGAFELDKGTARRLKRLESENRYYKDKTKVYQQMYIGAGHRIKELNAEVERLKQLVPVTVDPNTVKDKSDVIRRFSTMDLV